MINIGILRETKVPADNRVALSPKQIILLKKEYPQFNFLVQSSKERIFSDDEYLKVGIDVVEDLSDCDYLFGIKEVDADVLIPGKHYFFFGHIAKMQSYNKALLQAMIDKNITFTDYEYLTRNDGKRTCAFGWWAGVVGTYETLRLYGLKYKCFELPAPDSSSSVESLKNNLRPTLPVLKNRNVRILVTGKGRVSLGVQDILNSIGIRLAPAKKFLEKNETPCYCVVCTEDLVSRLDGGHFKRSDFNTSPQCFMSNFDRYISNTDILICSHSWQPGQPVYVSKRTISNSQNQIKVIGDITCDINGSIKTTVRPSTHLNPFYDIDSDLQEVPLFSDTDNISVMAIDNLPNALAREASTYFGERLCKYVFPALLNKVNENLVINRATILEQGRLTEPYNYLNTFLNKNEQINSSHKI